MYLFIYNYTPICCLHEFHLFPREFERSLRRNDQPGNKVCSTPSGRPTTLKRSGSDYSATIFAKILEASNVPGLQWQTGPGFRWDFCWGMMSKAQLYGDYFMNHEIRIPIKQPGFHRKWSLAMKQHGVRMIPKQVVEAIWGGKIQLQGVRGFHDAVFGIGWWMKNNLFGQTLDQHLWLYSG